MKETKNTIDGVEFIPDRASGNSTRQIDIAIYLLFNGFKVEVRDHWKEGTDKRCNIMLFEKIINRLSSEHNLFELRRNKMIKIDRNNLTIELM